MTSMLRRDFLKLVDNDHGYSVLEAKEMYELSKLFVSSGVCRALNLPNFDLRDAEAVFADPSEHQKIKDKKNRLFMYV